MSLRGRLTALSAVIVGTILALGSVVCFLVMRTELRGQIDHQLSQQSEFIRDVTLRDQGFPARLPKHPTQTTQGSAPYSQLITVDGVVIRPDGGSIGLPLTKGDMDVAHGRRGTLLTDRVIAGNRLRVITLPVNGHGAIQLGRPLASVDSALTQLRLVLALLVAGGIAIAALASRLFSRSVLAPIGDLTDAAEHIQATGDLSRQVDAERTDEVGRLATSFNAMLRGMQGAQEALGESIALQRQLVADASHELRTPVTGLRTNIEVLVADGAMDTLDRDALLEDVVEQTTELSSLVSDLIELARGDERTTYDEELDLADVTREAISRARRHAPRRAYETDLEPWPVVGSAERLSRAVNNLLDNAAKFSPQDSGITVRLRDGALSVRDRGPGVEDAELPHIFDRFYRGMGGAPVQGSGLGLAIVRQVAESHGGSVSAGSPDGGGLCVTLRMPQAPCGSAPPTELPASAAAG